MADKPTPEEVRRLLAYVPCESFKRGFISWFGESEHQGWDGYTPEELAVFEKFMQDFAVYTACGGLENPGGFMNFGGVQLEMESADPPLSEQEEREFADWCECWSPKDAWMMLGDYMSPSMKRAVVAEMQKMNEEEELSHIPEED